jgi:hypothetical protein
VNPQDRGEVFDSRGRLVAALPGEVKPCDGNVVVVMTSGWRNDGDAPRSGANATQPPSHAKAHGATCKCGGTSTLPIRRPKTELADTPIDDSLDALNEALASQGARSDKYMGDTTEHLMEHILDPNSHASSGSSRSKSKSMKRGEPGPKNATDGRTEDFREAVKGRPPRFGVTRRVRVGFSITPETAELLVKNNKDVADLAALILAAPGSQETIDEANDTDEAST